MNMAALDGPKDFPEESTSGERALREGRSPISLVPIYTRAGAENLTLQISLRESYTMVGAENLSLQIGVDGARSLDFGG
jgi:hypothetical protein